MYVSSSVPACEFYPGLQPSGVTHAPVSNENPIALPSWTWVQLFLMSLPSLSGVNSSDGLRRSNAVRHRYESWQEWSFTPLQYLKCLQETEKEVWEEMLGAERALWPAGRTWLPGELCVYISLWAIRSLSLKKHKEKKDKDRRNRSLENTGI